MRRSSYLPKSRIFGVAGMSLVLASALATTALGQDPAPTSTSLARYAPKDNLFFYLEYQGLDAHADAWKKTAAYKILNETPTGVMLEAVAIQLLNKFPGAITPGQAIGGWTDLTLFKHMARSGFLLAGFADEKTKVGGLVMVIRNGFKDKAVRGILAGILQRHNAPNTKPQAVVRAGHKVVSGVDAGGRGFAWWVEESKKEDLVMVLLGAEAADVVIETLDDKRPSARDHPRRAELLKFENRFLPTGMFFFDPKPLKPVWESPQAQKFGKDYGYLGLKNITSVDFRWGFQDDALMSLARVSTSGPRQGLLSLLDASTLDKAKLPPIPPNVSGFTAASLDVAGSLDRLRAQMKLWEPNADEVIDKFVEKVKARTRLRLKEDILAHLGPNVAWYVLPGKAAGAAASPASGMLGGLLGAGKDQVPKFAMVFDIDNPSAFGKVLDEAMIAANKELRSQGSPPGGDAAKGGRARGPNLPAPEFRLMPGETKMYVLNVPPELSGQVPASIRPSIRVGPKHVAIAISPDVARAALESKGNWTPANDLGVAFQGLPSSLKILNVSDPRETVPALLAAFPAKVQSLVNTAMLLRPGGPPPAGPGSPPPAGAADPSVPGGPRRPTSGSAGGDPGLNAGPGAPGSPGSPGAAPTPPAPAALVLQVDAAKLPKAEAIKALLYPSLFAVESGGDEIRVMSRMAFPEFGDPATTGVSLGLLLPAIQAARAAAARAAGRPIPAMPPPPAGIPAPGAGPAPAPGRGRPGLDGAPLGGGASPARPD